MKYRAAHAWPTMMAQLLPPAVSVAEAFNDDVLAPLFAEEAASIERAVLKRRLEFASVRACARRALGELGVPPSALVPGERGAPSWPAGVVGSMTHCDGYRACAAARTGEFTTVGIDAEPARPLPEGVLDLVTHGMERTMLSELAREAASVCWDRLLFSIKEATYKAWFPLARRWLGFSDAMVTIDMDGTFRAELLVPGPLAGNVAVDGFDGRWLHQDGLLLCAIAHVPRHPRRSVR